MVAIAKRSSRAAPSAVAPVVVDTSAQSVSSEANVDELETIARCMRGRLVEISHKTETAHLGGSLSCVDIMVAAYWTALRIDAAKPQEPNRDRFILSKGHACTTLYQTLVERGFFPQSLLDTYAQPGSPLAEHSSLGCAPGVEASTGSLGHGLSLGLGMALAARIQSRPYRVFALLSDGECNEGSVWEAAMFAAGQGLERVCAVVDFNKWQATGRSREVMWLDPLVEKWRAFGWSSYEVDGHDMAQLVDVLSRVPDGSGKPVAVIAHTVKGKGVSFMEDDNNWHYRIPTVDEVQAAYRELALDERGNVV